MCLLFIILQQFNFFLYWRPRSHFSLLFPASKFSHIRSLLSFTFMDSFIFNACICVYVYTYLFLSTTCSVHLMLLVCGLSGLTGTACPRGRPPFCSQLSSVPFSCLQKVESSFLIYLNNLYADFQSGWTSLHSYQQCLNLANICFLDDCRSDCGKMASWYQFVPMAQEYNLTLGMVRTLNCFFSARSLWLSVIFF